jgi:hypothetical protein
VEGADEVLAECVIYADLAADRAVDLREKRCRHVDERDTAQERRSGESRRVAHDAAAHGEDGAAAIRARLDERLVDARDGLEILVSLAVRDQDRFGPANRLLNRFAVQPPDRRAGHDEPPRADAMRVEDRRQPIDGALANEDGRGVRAGGDVDANEVRGLNAQCSISNAQSQTQISDERIVHLSIVR